MRRLRRASLPAAMVMMALAPLAPGQIVPIEGRSLVLAKDSALAAESKCDVVATIAGDRYSGTVLGIGADGWVRLTGPQFKNEVEIALSAVERIDFSPAKAMKMGPGVTLTNGDFVVGQIQSITPEQTTITNPELGTLSLPTAGLAEVRPNRSTSVYSDTLFESGSLEPWSATTGIWTDSGGKAVYRGGPEGEGVLSLPLDQKGPITFIVDFDSSQPPSVQCELMVFGDQPIHPNARNGISFRMCSIGQILGYSTETGERMLGTWQGNPMTPVTCLQLQYDPKEGRILPYFGSAQAGQYKFDAGPKTGRYVLFIAREPLAVKRLRVLPGIVPPDNAAPMPAAQIPGEKTAAESKEIRITLANGDVMSSKSVTLADGQLTIQTEFGDIQAEWKRVALIRFPRRAEAPAREAPAMYFDIQTSDGRLTLHSCWLTDETFAGRSELLGDLSFKRDILRSIRVHRSSP